MMTTPRAKIRRPYIGVCGFSDVSQVDALLEDYPNDAPRLVAIGVLMSGKSLKGSIYSYPERYPLREDVAAIFPDDPRTLNLIHYNTSTPKTLGRQLQAAVEIAGPHLDGFQLNMVWPSVDAIREVKTANPNIRFVLQISPHKIAKKSSEKTFEAIADRIRGDYTGLADYVLIDWSRGSGKSFEDEKLLSLLRALDPDTLSMTVGIAGGLGPETVHRCLPVLKEHPDTSLDAEGQLRTKRRGGVLDPSKARAYVERALALCSAVPGSR
jgi:phosphoribosylanthranilate isomerase